jgi:hypothetical protein
MVSNLIISKYESLNDKNKILEKSISMNKQQTSEVLKEAEEIKIENTTLKELNNGNYL